MNYLAYLKFEGQLAKSVAKQTQIVHKGCKGSIFWEEQIFDWKVKKKNCLICNKTIA